MNDNLQSTANRVRRIVGAKSLREQRMFGGITFMINGNMLCCVSKKGLMVRVGKEAEAAALASPFARRCRKTGRPMPGFIVVDPEGIIADDDLVRWLAMARAYVEALPPKPMKPIRATASRFGRRSSRAPSAIRPNR